MIGTLSFPQIYNFFAPAATDVKHGPTLVGGRVADPPRKKDDRKVARRSLVDAEKPRPSWARSLANSLPRGASPASNERVATYTAPYNGLQIEEQDPTLEEEIMSPALEEQYAQEQYLQETAAMEEMLQREFDPTSATPNLTAKQVAAFEEETRESILQEESLQQMPQDIQP